MIRSRPATGQAPTVTPELCTERGLRAPEGAVGALVGLRLPRVI
jgi:hypothetical protein